MQVNASVSALRYVIGFTVLFTASCEKDGPVGPQGPAGADGNATIAAYYFPNPPASSWQSQGAQGQSGYEFFTTFDLPALDGPQLQYGTVDVLLTAIQNGDTTQTALPFTDLGSVWSASWWFDMIPGHLTLHHANADGPTYNPGSAFLNDSLGFRVVLVSGQ